MNMQHVLMGDTDSCYVRLDLYAGKNGVETKPKAMIGIADRLQKLLKARLPLILSKKFLTSEEKIGILEPGREIVGRKALFKDKKKRYAIHILDQDGFSPKQGKELKVMGMETRRSDTPHFIQEFLTDCLRKVVIEDIEYDDMLNHVEKFREEFRKMDPWRQGSPGRVKNLTKLTSQYQKWEKRIAKGESLDAPRITHINVKAAYTTNKLMDLNNEKRWDKIRDGDKVEVIYLKPNNDLMECVAIKTGETYVPEWFKKLPFDSAKMEDKLIDKKIENVIGMIMNWHLASVSNYSNKVVIKDDFYG